jgi:segregation and condensation protein B
MDNPNLDNIVLALLFASEEPLSARKIAAVVEDVTVAEVKRAIDGWNARADGEAWSIGIEQVAGGYRLATRAEYAPYVSRLYAGRRKFRLSRAGLETLAIIAYKQPVTRAEVETVRGVGSGSVIGNLMERSLVQIVGKAHVLGAPFLYGTTPEFLEYLGLNSIRDLPSLEDLEALLAREAGEAALEGEDAAEAAAGATPGARAEREPADEGEEAEEALRSALSGAGNAGRASSARLGPRVEEPVNRPLDEDSDASTDGSDGPAASDEPAGDDAPGGRG